MGKFVRNAFRIAQIGNDKPGHVRQGRDGLGNVTVRGLLEVEEYWRVIQTFPAFLINRRITDADSLQALNLRLKRAIRYQGRIRGG